MKRFLAALAVAPVVVIGVVGFVAAGCNNYNNTFQQPTGATISFLAPADAFAGGSDFTLTLTGGGFVQQTVVQWNGQNRATTYVSPTVVTAAITAADITKPGTVFVNTLNPHRGGTDNGLSNTLAFIIRNAGNPVPALTSIAPTSASACGSSCANASFALTISGSNFVAASGSSGGSVVQWNMGPNQFTSAQPSPKITITSLSATQIVANVSGDLLSAAGTATVTATVTVYNPTPGGGISNGEFFTITPVPVAATGAEESPAISADGRYVAYTGSDGNRTQVFVCDTCTGADANCQPRTTLVSEASDGAAANNDSHSPAISADGRYIAFSSAATNLVSDAPSGRQVYLRETCFGAGSSCEPSTQLISTDPDGALTGTENILPSVSSSGRFVAFLSVMPSGAGRDGAAKSSGAPNSGHRQVFVRDTCLGADNCKPSTKRISLQPGDAPASGEPARPALSGDSRHVALSSRDATLFTRGSAVDDRLFLALTGGPR